MEHLPCVEIEPREEATAAVIWLHGLGANGHDFEPIVPELRLPADWPVRFVFPHAPSIPVTINGGMVMPAWYDIYAMEIDRRVDTEQLLASARAAQALIDREIDRGVDSRRIVLAGFSQGGAVGYQTALTCALPLAGLLALSTYFATRDTIERHQANDGLPIFIGHGLQDPIVPEQLGRRCHETLRELGYDAEYHSYPMQHSVCPLQIADIGEWMRRVLDPARAS